MDRRSFVVAGIAVLGSREVVAQTARIPRVGVLLVQPVRHPFMDALREGLRDLGYVENLNIRLEVRSVQGAIDELPIAASELARRNVDVIVAGGGTVGVRAAQRATMTIPIVFPLVGDPVAAGVVPSLARPGGNVTGQGFFDLELSAKRVELFKELLPKAVRVGILADPSMGMYADQVNATKKAATSLNIVPFLLDARHPADFAQSFERASKERVDGIVGVTSSFLNAHRERVARLALDYRLPTVWDNREYAEAGGLVSYGPNIAHLYRDAARFVDKILKGAKPSELPVEQVTKFELAVNLKTARALGIPIAPTITLRADQVID